MALILRLILTGILKTAALGFAPTALSNSYKITPAEFDLWMRLLQAVEGSVLWLLQDNVLVLKNLMIEAAKRGVDPKQLLFAKRADHGQYLARFQRADLYLDTFIYHAGAIASNALWAGLPVLTKRGRGYTARMAAIKAKLASNRITTPLFNTELFTQHLEAGYQQAYDRYLEGRAPDVIEVTMPV